MAVKSLLSEIMDLGEVAYFVSECQSVTSIKSEVKWRTLLRNKWRPFQRNRGDLCSGMGGVLCSGIVATFAAEYPGKGCNSEQTNITHE